MNSATCPTPQKRHNKLATALFLTLALVSYRSILEGDMPGGAREAKIQQLQPLSSLISNDR